VTEAPFQLSSVVAAGLREPVAEGVPQVLEPDDPEVAVGGLGAMDAAYARPAKTTGLPHTLALSYDSFLIA
jgi:hypothetical protein